MPTSYLLLLLFSLWPPAASVVDAASATVSPLFTQCNQSAGTYAANNSYGSNLRDLAEILAAGAGASGFAEGSSGATPDKVYDLVLCRGDYTGANCTDGLRAAFRYVNNSVFCRKAVVYYDQYMLRFIDDQESLWSSSNEPEWLANNMNSVKGANAAARLMDRVVELMNTMADLATSSSSSSSSSLYVTGEAGFGEQGVSTVYGMVQCRLDLIGPQCRSCLDGIVVQLPKLLSNTISSQRSL